MPKRLLPILVIVALAFLAPTAAGDTGTYRILDYRVKLTPHSDGTVLIAYYQKWLVTGGIIPWITVGTPNGDFDIVSTQEGTAVRRVRPERSGGWSGVRIDLDRTYRPDETFEVGFTVRQRGLFWADAENYRLDFTPGWYDEAQTDRLTVEVFFFAKTDTVTARPAPSRRQGQSLFWDVQALGSGRRFTLSVAFPKKLFPADLAVRSQRPAPLPSESPAATSCVFYAIGGLIVVLWLAWRIFAGAVSGGRYGGGGGIFYGGSGGSKSGGGWGSIFSGGGGGFGGRGASCACACAGCACACACAGGHAAGCDRKLRHTCPLCADCKVTDCPLHPARAP